MLATILDKIKPSPTIAISMKAAELKAAGKDIISLGMGEPDFDTANEVKEAAIKAINNGNTKYTAVDGIKPLKEAVIAKFKRDNNVIYNLNEVIVSTGAKQVIYNALVATINPGDEVIIPAPFWVSYPDMVLLTGGNPIIINTTQASNFKVKADDLEKAITNKTKWLIINSPSNPTGACYSEEELLEIAKVLLKYPHVNIMCDDIYEHLIFDNLKFFTLLQVEKSLKDRVLIVNGVSKAYSMTGWRIGYGVGPTKLIEAMSMIQSQSTSCTTSIGQHAALSALNGSQDCLEKNAKLFEGRRDLVVSKLNEINGIDCNVPNGAFYVFPSCQGMFGKKTQGGKKIENDQDFVEYLLEDALVAVVPGSAFGMEGFFRISYAASEKTLTEALERILKSCSKLS